MNYQVKFPEVNQASLKSRVPECTSQLTLNQGKTGASGGPKWQQIIEHFQKL